MLPIITTERLIIRSFEETDAQFMFKNWASDIESTKYTNMTIANNIESCVVKINVWRQYYDKGLFMWAICNKNDEPIGMVGFEICDNPEISFIIGKGYYRKGYATEALDAVITYSIKSLNIKSLWGYHFIENIAAGKVMLKAGMQFKEDSVKYNKYFNKDMTISIYEINV